MSQTFEIELKMKATPNHRRSRSRPSRRGAALLVCLMVIFMSVLLVVQILDTLTLNLASERNAIDYQRALFLANAGIHEAASELENDPNWRGVVTDGAYPGHNAYSAAVVDGTEPGAVAVTSTGISGNISRTVTALIEL